ncbi:MAG: hypothetical protein ACREVX_14975 [Clostridium sp.]|uniref:hypothetical protein n=1 Tax=Clostridium sp. TaxID=1506 RepID=UPI003D6C7AF6
MSLKKKRGSSLIAVLLIFAVLSISGLSILSLTVSDYNARITASKKIQSLYASDSGVNAVYGIMKKVTSQATQKGNKVVDDYMKDSDGTLTGDALKTKLDDIFKDSYKKSISAYILENKLDNITSPNDYLKDGTCKDLEGNTLSIYDSADANQPIIAVELNSDSYPLNPNQWKLNITSHFSTNPTNGQTSNKKNVTANIILSIHGYKGSYVFSSVKQVISINPVWKNAISIDGDMHINSNLTVNGNVFVKGTPPVVAMEKVYTKYNGGISIGSDDTQSITANFNGDVVTSNSFNISGQNKTVNVDSNVYAGNVYIGKSNSLIDTDTSNCDLNVKNTSVSKGMVYTSNDLSLNATKSHIDIDKYYGINAIDKVRTVDEDYNSSSGIIVNTNDIGTPDGSWIKLGDAIINGTAYINTSTPYQTGESVAIKGNYRVYTVPIPKSIGTLYDENKVDFAYNSPLQIVNNFKGTNEVLKAKDKAEYFRKVDTLNLMAFNKSGIFIKNLIYSVGVAISDGSTLSKSFDISKTNVISSKQNDFARVVYEMGVKTEALDVDYLQGIVNKTVFDKNAKLPQVTLDGVDDSNVIDNANSEVEVRTKSKNVVLLGNNSTYVPDPVKDEVVNLSTMNGDPHGIIITSGNVTLSGTINFSGTIIAGGNVITLNDGTKTLTYDDNYVLKTIAINYTNTYSKAFKLSSEIGTQTVDVATTVGKSSNSTNITTDEVVKLSNWRVSN